MAEKELSIHCISDTHMKHGHFTMPGGDILIHAGDMTSSGKLSQVIAFLEWFGTQDYAYKVLIPGNHDWAFETNWSLLLDECKQRDIALLNDSGLEIEGIKIWGSAITPWFHSWAFNRFRGDDIRKHWDLIPADTEILVTHGPPYEILDEVNPGTAWADKAGCKDLMDKILKTKVKLHIFGHIHEGRGYKYLNGITYINASSLNENYSPNKDVPIKVTRGIDDTYIVENESLE